jgi:hypothetical protein
MQGGVCGDGMKARRTALLLAGGGGLAAGGTIRGTSDAVLRCALGVLQGWWNSNGRGKKWDSKRERCEEMEGRVVYGMNRSAGGVRPGTKQPSLPSWIVARPFIPSVWRLRVENKRLQKTASFVDRLTKKMVRASPSRRPCNFAWMLVVVVEGDGREGDGRDGNR